MGLAGFATMLLSMLSFMFFLNAFPYRKKVNKPMLVLMLAMFAVIIFADCYYMSLIWSAVSGENPIVVNESTMYIKYAYDNLRIHVGILAVAIVLIALLPVYSKMLRKIKTSIDVEGNGDMGAIDISGED